MNSGPITAMLTSTDFGLRLPDRAMVTGLTAQEAYDLLKGYWKITGDEMGPRRGGVYRPLNWTCELTFRGLVVVQGILSPIQRTIQVREPSKEPHHIAELLRLILKWTCADLVLDTPLREDLTVDGMLQYLQERGCGAVEHSAQWEVGYFPYSSGGHPWDVAQVIVFHPDAGTIQLPSDCGADYLELSGSAPLRNQLLSLSSFALETGHLLHDYVFIAGPNGWTTTVHAWELGLVGYTIVADRGTVSGAKAFLLQRVEGPDQVVVEATHEN